MPQFIKCRFSPVDSRRYTYLNEGERVEVGDFVKVPDARHDGRKRVEVMEVDVEEPQTFTCKPILGKLTGQDLDEAIQRRTAAQ